MPESTVTKAPRLPIHWLMDRKNQLCIVDAQPEPTELERAVRAFCESPTH